MLFETSNRNHHGSLSPTSDRNRSPSSASVYDNLVVTIATALNGDIS
jgi:hypothetical protein